MVDPVRAARLFYRSLFLFLAGLILFWQLLPLSSLPARVPAPDLLLALIMVWVLRRPNYIPVLFVAGIVLLQDFLVMRPPGLWTALVLIWTEFLRSREATLRDLHFLLEWLAITAAILSLTLAYRLSLAVFLVPQAGPGIPVLQAVTTILAYPVVAFLSHMFLGLRRTAPGEVDALGHRL